MTLLSKPCALLAPASLRALARPPLCLLRPQLRRGLASNTPATASEDRLAPLRPKMAKAGIIGAGMLALYGVSTFLFDMTFFFVNMSPGDVAYYAFGAGFATAAVFGAGIYSLNRYATIRPERVFRESVSLLNGSRLLREKLGGDISTEGTLRAYRLDRGYIDLEGRKLVWRPPRVQMIFGIAGPKHNGIAVVEAAKKGMHNDIQYCGVDILNSTEDHVLLKGESANSKVREQLRELVSFKPRQIKST